MSEVTWHVLFQATNITAYVSVVVS